MEWNKHQVLQDIMKLLDNTYLSAPFLRQLPQTTNPEKGFPVYVVPLQSASSSSSSSPAAAQLEWHIYTKEDLDIRLLRKYQDTASDATEFHEIVCRYPVKLNASISFGSTPNSNQYCYDYWQRVKQVKALVQASEHVMRDLQSSHCELLTLQ